MARNRRPKVASLFSGAGCFDLGFEAAGFQTILASDIDKSCCATIQQNRRWNVINSPIEELTNRIFTQQTSLRRRELDLLIGGPPCQPYSKSAYGVLGTPLGFDDDRAKTLNEYLRLVEAALPKAFIIENVPQFLSGKNERVRKHLHRKIAGINRRQRTNYYLNIISLNAAWYGVPQLRERVFVVASIEGKRFELPQIQFYAKGDPTLGIEPYRTSWDALSELNVPSKSNLRVGGKWEHLLRSIPPGQNYLWHTERGGGDDIFEWRSRYWNFLLKLHPLFPSWTIAAQPGQHTGPFHWENRRLSTMELQAIQTIPLDYEFAGSQVSIRRQIGNGVPSAIGELLGKEVRKQFWSENVNSDRLSLIPTQKSVPRRLSKLAPTRRLAMLEASTLRLPISASSL